MALNETELSSDIDVDIIVTTVDEESVTDKINREQINNEFWYPINNHRGVTGSVIKEDGVLYVHKYLRGEYHYEPFEIYGDTNESTTILAHSTDSWSLCDSVSSFKDNPMVKSDDEFDKWLLEQNRQMVYQGMTDEYKDYQVYEANLE